jgi:hypothetical protein
MPQQDTVRPGPATSHAGASGDTQTGEGKKNLPLAIKCRHCECTVAEVAPGGVLILRRDHYGNKHETRVTLYELLRFFLMADARK